jgi:hypothetical protein
VSKSVIRPLLPREEVRSLTATEVTRSVIEQFHAAFNRGDLEAATSCFIHMYRVLHGKIAEHFANRDDVGMVRQLVVLPSSPSSQ